MTIDCEGDPVEAALWLARAFVDGRRLAVCAPGAPDHAHHVAVEFVHPVITGARALPAIASSGAIPSGGGCGDALLVIGHAGDPGVAGDPDPDPGPDVAGDPDLVIRGGRPDAGIVRAYHLLWELVQVALEHPGVVGGEAAAGGDATGFLYPFLDAAEDDEAALRAALDLSATAKRRESAALAATTLVDNDDALDAVAVAVASAATATTAGRVLTMGNGGSATDAARLTRRLQALGVAAHALATDYAVVSALANDLGAEQLFVRQIEAFGRAGDVLIGCSTSGSSPNLLAAFGLASKRGLTTVAISGYRGGAIRCQPVDHLLAVDSQSVHRIQEAQAALIDELCDRVTGDG